MNNELIELVYLLVDQLGEVEIDYKRLEELKEKKLQVEHNQDNLTAIVKLIEQTEEGE